MRIVQEGRQQAGQRVYFFIVVSPNTNRDTFVTVALLDATANISMPKVVLTVCITQTINPTFLTPYHLAL